MTYYQPQRITDQRGSVLHVLIAWAFALFTLLYFLPWAVAATRYKSNTLAIALVNFLLGWTFIGWVVALVMACGSHQSSFVPAQGYYPPPGYPQGPPLPGALPPGYVPHGHVAPGSVAPASPVTHQLPPVPPQAYVPPASRPGPVDLTKPVSRPAIRAAAPNQHPPREISG